MTTTTNPTDTTTTMSKPPITELAERPTEEQTKNWSSCRILAAMHDLEAAIDAADSQMAKIQLRAAYNSAGRAMLAQVQAESYDGRRLPLDEEQEA